MVAVGDTVRDAAGTRVGTVHRVYRCTWGRRRGRVHSVSLNDRISVRLRGARRYVEMRTVLFWSDATSAWHDRLARGTVYTIVAEGGGGGPS